MSALAPSIFSKLGCSASMIGLFCTAGPAGPVAGTSYSPARATTRSLAPTWWSTSTAGVPIVSTPFGGLSIVIFLPQLSNVSGNWRGAAALGVSDVAPPQPASATRTQQVMSHQRRFM